MILLASDVIQIKLSQYVAEAMACQMFDEGKSCGIDIKWIPLFVKNAWITGLVTDLSPKSISDADLSPVSQC